MKNSLFNLTHTRTYTGYMGDLIPSMLLECMPADKFRISCDQLLRLSPLVAPVLHEVLVLNDWFFVPNRLLMTDWATYITGGVNGTDTTVPPYVICSSPIDKGSLLDYLGLPVGSAMNLNVSAFPMRAYALIWNEFYRDQNLQSALTISLGNGSDTTTNLTLQKRCWEKDYFTSALNATQRGTSTPIGVNAPVVMVDTSTNAWKAYNATTNSPVGAGTSATDSASLFYGDGTEPTKFDPRGGLVADLAQVTVNDLRLSFQLQKFKERSMRSGSRLVEHLKAFFGAYLPDYTAQRPQHIGHSINTVLFSEVLQTSSTDATTPQGNMAGHGISMGQSRTINFKCNEHGYIMQLTTVMPRTQYGQGIPKLWLRTTRFDHPTPIFANIGEQAIYNKELYAFHSSPEGIFGYTPRYQEMRLMENSVHGEFRPGGNLDFWNICRNFASDPSLNATFVKCEPRTDIFAANDEPNCYMMQRNNVSVIRVLPKEGTPGYIDHN